MARERIANVHGATLSRRGFLAAGGVLAVTVALAGKAGAVSAGPSGSLDAGDPHSWIEIAADNTVTIRTGKCDFGQSSIYTAYRQAVAEELGMPLEAMTRVITGDTDRTPDGGGTFGLLRTNLLNLRKAAAYTREAVLDLAAAQLGASRAGLAIVDGEITGGGHPMSVGALIEGQSLELTIPVEGELTSFMGLVVAGDPPLKDPSTYSIIGQAVKNPITREKISGETLWVGDVKLPGMLHARTIHPATLGSTLVEAGQPDTDRYPGAQVVTIGNLVAVVSEDEWEAVLAARQVEQRTSWSEWQGLPGSDGLYAHLTDEVDWSETASTPGRANAGDVEAAAADAAQRHAASYFVPFIKHAPIGPMVSLAEVAEDGKVILHTHTQNPQFLRMALAKMLGEGEDRVVVRTYPGPSHFGRSNGGNAGSEDEAVLLARELGRPVRVQWMRHDDMQWSTQSSALTAEIAIDLDEDGMIAGYDASHRGPPMQDDRLVGAILAGLPTIDTPSPEATDGIQAVAMSMSDRWVYDGIANVREEANATYPIGQRESPLATGLRNHSMRTPIQFQQNFPRELAITEAAIAAGKDPLQFRLDHVNDPRFTRVLETLRSESGWQDRPSPAPAASATGEGEVRGQGCAIMWRDHGYWGCAAHVAVTPATGEVRVERLTVVADTGIVVNPLQLKRQIEGGSLMGVSEALKEEVAFDSGRVTSSDWNSYPILTMGEMPEMNVVIAASPEVGHWGQGSESANAMVAPAVAAAVLDATGKPVRRIPLRPQYVLEALSA